MKFFMLPAVTCVLSDLHTYLYDGKKDQTLSTGAAQARARLFSCRTQV